MKIKIIPIFILIICCGTAWGQSVIYEFPTLEADSAIVRNWRDEGNIIYASTKDPYSTNYFLLIDRISIYKIEVPADITVNDFRVLNDTVYFGGHKTNISGDITGVLASFSVYDFFIGSGLFHWWNLPNSIARTCNMDSTEIKIRSIMRLVIYDTNSCIQIAYIAKHNIDIDPLMRIGIGWAKFDGATWQSQFIFNKDAKELYTDIIATDNYVISTARTNDSSRLALRVFPKSKFISPMYSCYYFYPDKYGDGWADHILDSDVMATAMGGNSFAVAYHFMDGSSTGTGLAIKTFHISGGRANLADCWDGFIAPPSIPKWKIKDIRYSSITQRLLVLDDVWLNAAVGYTSQIFQFQQPFAASGTYGGCFVRGWRTYSLDLFDPSGIFYASVGNIHSNQLMLFWEDLNISSSCGEPVEFMGSTTSANRYRTYMETYTCELLSRDITTTFSPSITNREIICNH